MNQQQIEWLKSLDPDGMDGDIQSVLLGDVRNSNFENALRFILMTTLQHKEAYKEENKKLTDVLKKYNLYTDEIIFGG